MDTVKKLPLVSIIIPAYNHEKYVASTIRSVLEQDYPNLELIIVNDGSSDNTLKKIKELEEECKNRFVRFVLKTQENQGTCATLNRLIHLAKGEYIALIASDDYYKKNAISTLVSALDGNENYVLAVGNNEFINLEDERITYTYHVDNQKIIFENMKDIMCYYDDKILTENKFGKYSSLLVRNHIPNGYLIRAKALKTIEFTPEAPLEDLYMHLQLSKLGLYKYIDEILFSYRRHDKSTSNNNKHMEEMENKTLAYEQIQTLDRNDAFSEMVLLHYIQQKALQKKTQK